MMSKKWAFSLTSLITILALAFVVTPAMAGEFGVSLYEVKDATGDAAADTLMDVSHADGLQVQPPADDDVLRVTVKYDRAVALAKNNMAAPVDGISISGYDKDGNFLPFVKLLAAAGSAIAADADTVAIWPVEPAKMITLRITIGQGTGADRMTASKVTLKIAKGIASSDLFNDDTSKELKTDIHLLPSDPPSTPDVWKIALVGEPFSPITTATFQTHILLSEEPKGGFNKDLIEVSDADVASVVKLASPMAVPMGIMERPAENNGGTAEDLSTVAAGLTTNADRTATSYATWRDDKIHLYLVTFNTKEGEKTVKIKVKDFAGMERPTGAITQPSYVRKPDSMLTEGRDILTVKTNTALTTPKSAGIEVKLLNEGIIPANGYLVVAKKKGDSAIRDPGDAKKSPAATARQPFALTYNLIEGGLQNLESFLSNGGTIDLVAPQAGLIISEIMWGTDASLNVTDKSPVNSQYIEIRNTGAQIKMGDGTHKLVFYAAGSTLPDMSVAANNIQDRVGTVGAGGFWSIAGKGQSGRTGIDEGAADVVAVKPTQALISMQRSISAAGVAADGTMESSWAASSPPGLNFDLSKEGTRIGSPGRAPTAYPVAPTPAPEPTPAPVIPVAMADDIHITEIMVDTGNNRLPQWIELTNMSGAEKSLAGWSVEISNSSADADVVGAKVSINLMGTIGVGGGEGAGGTHGQAVLLVAWGGRSSSNLSKLGDRLVNVSGQLNQKGRYTLLSPMGFMIELLPPQTTGVVQFGDTAGNLGASPAWDLPMSEDGRSSLIRYAMLNDGTATMGTDANGWVLASSTDLVDTPATWYGSDEDAGTPGVIGGGPLPVELSHFRPARDKATGAVVITWATQSELNNAGFFIKRSNQKDGEFKVINATMIPGAGTTSEKQFYTYTDTTAQPNIVYYYQIEDVSLDGNRQTLTRGIRLKGHIGAAGKLTSTWGELKSSNE